MLKRLFTLATFGLASLALLPANASASAAGPASPIPSCAAMQAAHRLSPGGDFVVPQSAVFGLPLHLRCVRQNDQFLAYLLLPNIGGGSNQSTYAAASGDPRGGSVTTHYVAIRFDPFPISWFPLIFAVNIADETFSMSVGSRCHTFDNPCPTNAQVTSMPLGVAMDCVATGSSTGTANIDLRGTSFAVVNTFRTGGYIPAGSTTTSANGQVVDVTGGGYCGWNAPAVEYNPYNDNPRNDAYGGWDLLLTVGH